MNKLGRRKTVTNTPLQRHLSYKNNDAVADDRYTYSLPRTAWAHTSAGGLYSMALDSRSRKRAR